MSDGHDIERGLTPSDVAAVLRRAAELDAADAAIDRRRPEIVPAQVVEEAGVEAGISRAAVQRALAELVVAPASGGLEVHRTGIPDRIEVLRDVPGPARDVSGRIERYLRRQVFVRQRIYQNGSRWVHRRGPISALRRFLFARRRQQLRLVGAVDVRVADDPSTEGQVLVRIDADLGVLRRRQIARAAVGTTLVAAGSGWLVALNGPELLLIVVPVGGGAIAGMLALARSMARTAVTRAETALHGLLDRVEHGPRDARAALKSAMREQRDAALMQAAEQMRRSTTGRSWRTPDVPDAAADG
jgi:hypothetical protein